MNSSSETHERAPRSRIRYSGGGAELLYIKSTSEDQTLILTVVLNGNLNSYDFPRILQFEECLNFTGYYKEFLLIRSNS